MSRDGTDGELFWWANGKFIDVLVVDLTPVYIPIILTRGVRAGRHQRYFSVLCAVVNLLFVLVSVGDKLVAKKRCEGVYRRHTGATEGMFECKVPRSPGHGCGYVA